MDQLKTELLLASPPTGVAGLTLYGVSLPLLVVWLNLIYIAILLARVLYKTYKEWKE